MQVHLLLMSCIQYVHGINHPLCQGPGRGLYNTAEAVAAFNVNRLDWVYSYNASWVDEALHKWGLRVVSLSMNANLPDQPPSVLNTNVHMRDGQESQVPQEKDIDGGSRGDTYNVGRMLDVLGRPVAAPWMRTWNPVPYVQHSTYATFEHDQATFCFLCLLVSVCSSVDESDVPATTLIIITVRCRFDHMHIVAHSKLPLC